MCDYKVHYKGRIREGKEKYPDISVLLCPEHYRRRSYFIMCVARLSGGELNKEAYFKYPFHLPTSLASH